MKPIRLRGAPVAALVTSLLIALALLQFLFGTTLANSFAYPQDARFSIALSTSVQVIRADPPYALVAQQLILVFAATTYWLSSSRLIRMLSLSVMSVPILVFYQAVPLLVLHPQITPFGTIAMFESAVDGELYAEGWPVLSALGWWIIAILLLMLWEGVVFVASRRRHGCRKCGYSLRGLSSTQCPECGASTRSHLGSNPSAA